MTMDYREPKKRPRKTDKNSNFFESAKYALQGLVFIFKSERNFRFDMWAFVVVMIAGLFFRIKRWEWIAVFLACFTVLSFETINTINEYIVDLITGHQWSFLAKIIKDMSAGLTLLAAIFAVIIGLLVFLPYLLKLFA